MLGAREEGCGVGEDAGEEGGRDRVVEEVDEAGGAEGVEDGGGGLEGWGGDCGWEEEGGEVDQLRRDGRCWW